MSEPQTPDRSLDVFHWRWVGITIALAAVVGAAIGALLWGHTTADHRDAFDTGWKSSAAVLAILASVLTVERLRLSQREHQRQLDADRAAREESRRQYQRQLDADLAGRADAVARQITDLSAKASDQLGSEKAAVRIGGLTDMERLGQTFPDLRQIVMDRICAYLRAPYEPPPEDSASSNLSAEQIAARRLELDVRRTAQQIVRRHLHWPADITEQPDTYWATVIELDLRDAVLVEFDLSECRIPRIDFRKATFARRAWFHSATFSDNARFIEAVFFGWARFDRTTFSSDASFISATFPGPAEFTAATFSGYADFGRATFSAMARFDKATFSSEAWFHLTTFSLLAWFSEATFSGRTEFDGTTFSDLAKFDRTTFSDLTKFDRTTFSSDAGFDEATFSGNSYFGGATFSGNARFNRTTFSGQALFNGVKFSGNAVFDWTTFSYEAWFEGARFSGNTSFARAGFEKDGIFGGVDFGNGQVTFENPRVWGPPEPTFDWDSDVALKPNNVAPRDWPPKPGA